MTLVTNMQSSLFNTEARKTLVFGGSFNPIHRGHLAAARFARDSIGFDHVIFLPCGDNYGKRGLIHHEHRLAMLYLAIRDEPGFEVEEVEARSDVRMRNVETLREIRAARPDDLLVLFRGLDALNRTHRRLFNDPGLQILVLDRADSKARFEQILLKKPHLNVNRDRIWYAQGAFSHPASSTKIRHAVLTGGEARDLVPGAVADYIQDKGLYLKGNEHEQLRSKRTSRSCGTSSSNS